MAAAFGQLLRLSGLRTPRPAAMTGFRRMFTGKAEADAAAHQRREAHYTLLYNRYRSSQGQYQPTPFLPKISDDALFPMSCRNFRLYMWTSSVLGIVFPTGTLVYSYFFYTNYTA